MAGGLIVTGMFCLFDWARRAQGVALMLGLVLVACKPRPAVEGVTAAEDETAVEVVEPTAPADPEEAALDKQAPELTINRSSQVSILCYHAFCEGPSPDDMTLNINRFRQQMQALKDAKLPVISMEHFLAWKRGERDIPDPSIMITMDDGWKSVYTLAAPVLREFGYPYTIFLYKNYVGGGGKALTVEEIRQLMKEGATIGSHSWSHPFPSVYRRKAKEPPEQYEAWLKQEYQGSREFLESTFGVKVTTFAYPGGYYTADIAKKSVEEWGYEALFTVNPVRVDWDTPMAELGRFVIMGRDESDRSFKAATNFGGGELGQQLLGRSGEANGTEEPLVTVLPAENATITERRPVIEADLSKLEGVVPESVVMRIPGFGQVPAEYDPATGRVRYQPVAPLRSPDLTVHIRLRRQGQTKDDLISWKFFIDQKAHYLSLLEPEKPVEAPAEASQPPEPRAATAAP